MFERAIELDSAYGPAYAGLATVHATLYEWFGAQTRTCRKPSASVNARSSSRPISPQAHVARGCALSRRYDEAAREFRRRRGRASWSQRSLELYPDDLSTLVAPPACTPGQATRKRRSTFSSGCLHAAGEVRLDRARRDYDNLRDDPRFARLVAKAQIIGHPESAYHSSAARCRSAPRSARLFSQIGCVMGKPLC